MIKSKRTKLLIMCSLASLIGLSAFSFGRISSNKLSAINGTGSDLNIDNNRIDYAEDGDITDPDASKYILSPINATNLNSTFGSNYYILVSEVGDYFEDNDGGKIKSFASAFCGDTYALDTMSFNFQFADVNAKTIDIRDLGAHAGGCIFAFVSETVQDATGGGGTTTYNNLVSMSQYSFVGSLNADSPLETQNITSRAQAINFQITKTEDYNHIPAYTFYNNQLQSYLYGNQGVFRFDENDGASSISTDQGIIEINANSYVYVYSVSEALAQELCFGAAAAKIDDEETTTNYRDIYRTLPYYERISFYEFANSPNRSITSLSGETDSFHVFGQKVFDGVDAYLDEYSYSFGGYDMSHYNLTIDYEHGYISGFSPFEPYVTIVFDGLEGFSGEPFPFDLSLPMSDDEPYYTAKYKNPKLYLENVEGLSLYGTSFSLYLGDYANFSQFVGGYKSITVQDYDAFDGTSGLEVAYSFGTNTEMTECIFDGEIQLQLLGTEGEYEYALVDGELVDRWGSYASNAKLDDIRWQTSPIFTTCLTKNGIVDLDEEMYLTAFFRRKGTDTTITSPVLGVLNELYTIETDEGYIRRMNVLNEELFEEYEEEYALMYDELNSVPEFEDISLFNFYDDVDLALEELETKEDAYGLQTPEGLKLGYDTTVYIHSLFHDNFMDIFTPNQTTRSESINNELYLHLRYYEIDFDLSYEEQVQAINDMVNSYLTLLTAGLNIDALCKTFISEFNAYLKNNPAKSQELWNIFDVYFFLIHDCETLAQAQTRYQEAISAITNIING